MPFLKCPWDISVMVAHGHLDTCLELGGETSQVGFGEGGGGPSKTREFCRPERERLGRRWAGAGWVRSAQRTRKRPRVMAHHGGERDYLPSPNDPRFSKYLCFGNASVPFLPFLPAIFLHILWLIIPHYFLYEASSEFLPEDPRPRSLSNHGHTSAIAFGRFYRS